MSTPASGDQFAVDYAATVAVHGGSPTDELMQRFWAYEAALAANDVDALDELFADSPDTMRGDAAGLLVGYDRIKDFRAARGGAPPRIVREIQRRDVGQSTALLVAVTELAHGGRGQQTQLWQRSAGTWKVTAAHVSVPASAMDSRTWRVVGDPLVPSSQGHGPLVGETVAVKDLFAVAGQRIGAGSVAWLQQAQIQPDHAIAVQTLLEAGAQIRGMARTDEFAYSLAGTNSHYGTPPNPAAPSRISGGSSSGSASAVAQGQATIGLGTDTGGSIRVPAAYQGLWGIRTTHGAISRTGLLPLAPSFDTVGWMTRSAEELVKVTEVMMAQSTAPAEWTSQTELTLQRPVILEGLLALAEPDVARAVRAAAQLAGAGSEPGPSVEQAHSWRQTFQTVQAGEAWANHGQWVAAHRGSLSPDVAARFEVASRKTAPELKEAAQCAATLKTQLRALVGSRVMILPSASSVAPLITEAAAGGPLIEAARAATMALTSLAGLAGLPAVSVPVRTESGLPAGLCMIGPAGSDSQLAQLAADLFS